jgi:hypothetical protein
VNDFENDYQSSAQKKKRGYTVCSSDYAAADTSSEKEAVNSSALTVTLGRLNHTSTRVAARLMLVQQG